MPFLATMTGASAGMFSIVAGFLVSRFVGLDSEQQANERDLNELEEELATIRQRAAKTTAAWVRLEAELIFEMENVLDAVCEGNIDVDTLRRRCPTPLSDEQLLEVAHDVHQHYLKAFDTLHTVIHAIPNIAEAEVDQLEDLKDWDEVRAAAKGIPAEPEWPDVWEHALGRVVDELIEAAERRKREAQEREREIREREKAMQRAIFGRSFPDFTVPSLQIPATIPMPSAPLLRGQPSQERAQRRIDLSNARATAERQIEDAEAEIQRIQRHSVVVPIKELVRGLLVLLTLGVLGVVNPLLLMSQGPEEYTPTIESLRWTFLFAFLLLVIYLASFAGRLWRKVSKLTGHAGSSTQKEASP